MSWTRTTIRRFCRWVLDLDLSAMEAFEERRRDRWSR